MQVRPICEFHVSAGDRHKEAEVTMRFDAIEIISEIEREHFGAFRVGFGPEGFVGRHIHVTTEKEARRAIQHLISFFIQTARTLDELDTDK